MIKKKDHIAYLTYSFIESVITSLSFLVAYWVRGQLPSSSFEPLFPFSNYVGLLLVVILLWNLLFVLGRTGGKAATSGRVDVIKEVALTVLTGNVLIGAAIFILKYDFISRFFIVIFAAIDFVFLCLFRIYAKAGISRFRNLLNEDQNVLIVGTDEKAAHVAEVLEASRDWGYRLVGVVRESPQSIVDKRLEAHTVVELDGLGEVLKNRVIDEVIFVVPKEALARMEEIFLVCEEEGIKTRVMLSFFPHVTSKIYLEALHDLPLLTFTTTPQNEYLLFVKNAVDIVLAAALIVVLTPILLLIALLVKLTSRGPAIFTQIRCGLGGRKFVLYKFRSMIHDAEVKKSQLEHLNEMSGPVFKLSNDPRCTPLGRLLRKFSLDEFPQLINILRGDMSFVGPRPPIPEEVERYQRWQRRRLRMKPGLTCLWQVSGRNEVDFAEWMRMDLEYIDSWSLLLDLKILLKTIPIVVFGKGA
jgi:exopolysaccharide biosynthesis polyprenyl glycosylphosphotransferase